MNYLLDIFFVLLFILITIIGTERGFVDSVWSSVTIIGSFVVAYLFGGVAADWICDNFVLKYNLNLKFEFKISDLVGSVRSETGWF